VAKGFNLEPGLASDPVGATNKSALAAKHNNNRPVVVEVNERVFIGRGSKARRASVSLRQEYAEKRLRWNAGFRANGHPSITRNARDNLLLQLQQKVVTGILCKVRVHTWQNRLATRSTLHHHGPGCTGSTHPKWTLTMPR
jgi:hypothetical protein